MFGPNVSTSINQKVNFHHREEKFINVYAKLVKLFKKKFDIPRGYEVIIQTGSGTLAVESLIATYNGKLDVNSDDLQREKFAKRWSDVICSYDKFRKKSRKYLQVQYETSQSKYNGLVKGATIVDAVSAFPYFPKPTSPVWVTVSSKMLGAVPVLGIIVIKKSFARKNFLKSPSYLNPLNYLNYQKIWQTPFTPSIPLCLDFYEKLKTFNIKELREKILNNYEIMTKVIDKNNLVNGGEVTPVLTVKPGVIPNKIIEKWKLYGYKSKGYIQIFLYAEPTAKYKKLAQEIKKAS